MGKQETKREMPPSPFLDKNGKKMYISVGTLIGAFLGALVGYMFYGSTGSLPGFIGGGIVGFSWGLAFRYRAKLKADRAKLVKQAQQRHDAKKNRGKNRK